MSKSMSARFAFAALAITLSASLGCYAPLDTAPNVDTTELSGTWFEIGHLPRSTQDGCSGTTATYLPQSDDGHFSVTHECTLPDGTHLVSNATLYVLDKSNTAKLGIDLGGFIGEYWIIDVASDYRYVVVGHPSRDYFWILSRAREMDAADLTAVLAKAKSAGFDTSRVEYTKQDGTPATQTDAGCSASTAKHATGGAAFGLAALGLVAVLRRRRLSDSTARCHQASPRRCP